jgi:hypothetical protein
MLHHSMYSTYHVLACPAGTRGYSAGELPSPLPDEAASLSLDLLTATRTEPTPASHDELPATP